MLKPIINDIQATSQLAVAQGTSNGQMTIIERWDGFPNMEGVRGWRADFDIRTSGGFHPMQIHLL